VAGRRSSEKNLFCTFLPASHVGEQTGGEKSAILQSLWPPLVKLLSQGGSPHTIKIGRMLGISEINQKIEPRIGYRYQINLQSRARGKKVFT
jgi:hypothetical protein